MLTEYNLNENDWFKRTFEGQPFSFLALLQDSNTGDNLVSHDVQASVCICVCICDM